MVIRDKLRVGIMWVLAWGGAGGVNNLLKLVGDEGLRRDGEC